MYPLVLLHLGRFQKHGSYYVARWFLLHPFCLFSTRSLRRIVVTDLANRIDSSKVAHLSGAVPSLGVL